MKQVSAINGRYEALYELLKYASQRLARADENIQRVMIGRPMIEEDIQDVTDISEYIY